MQSLRLRVFISLSIILVVLILDYASKKYAEELNQIIILNSFLAFHKIDNSGIAFSLFDNLNDTGLLVLNLTITMILIIILRELFLNIRKSLLYIIGLSLVLGGGLGNLIDRFDNYTVTDFISVNFGDLYFPAIFNLADMFITIGALLIIIYFLKYDSEYS